MSKIIVLTLIILAIIVVVYKMKSNKQPDLIIPVESLNVENLKKQFENDLEVEDIEIENVSEEELESTTEAIISELEAEAEESLPESLNPNVSEIAISDKDKLELETLLSGDSSIVLGAMRSLGLTLSPIEKAKKIVIDQKINKIVSSPEVENEEKRPIETEQKEQKEQKVLETLKEKVIVEEVKKIKNQEKFIKSQIKNVDETIQNVKKEGEKEIRELVKDQEKNPSLRLPNQKRIQEIKEKTDLKQLELSEKSNDLKNLSKEKKQLATDVLNKKITPKRVKKLKSPRKSKKGRVTHVKKKLESGGSSFKLSVPSDLNPEDSDEISIEISKQSEEIIRKYEIIKQKIITDKSLDNVSDEEKKIIKAAGKEFKKIKSSYVNKRTEKIRSRKKKIKAAKAKIV